MASTELVRLARAAARATAKAGRTQAAWVERFGQEYGHDASTGDLSVITIKFIDQHSAPET